MDPRSRQEPASAGIRQGAARQLERLAASPVLRKVMSVLYYGLFAALLALVASFLWRNLDVLAVLYGIPAHMWALAVVLYLATLIAKGASFDILAKVFGASVPLKDSVALTSAGLLANYMLPGNTAIPLRSLYLQRLHGLSYKRFIPLALAAFVFSTGLYGVAAGAAALAIGPVASVSYQGVMTLFAGGGLALIVLLLLPLPYDRIPYIGRIAGLALEGWRLLISSPRLFSAWLVVEVVRASLEVAYFFAVARMLGVPIGAGEALIITLAKECSVFLRLTPGAFGVAEGVQAFFAVAFGLDAARVVLAGLSGRVIEIICLAIASSVLVGDLKAKIAGAPATQSEAAGLLPARGSGKD